MTSQEAQKKIDQCETAITSAFRALHAQAQSTVMNVDKAASGYTSAATLLPLLISLIGIIMLATKHWFGIILLVVGIFIAVKAHQSAKYTENRAKTDNGYLRSALERYKDI